MTQTTYEKRHGHLHWTQTEEGKARLRGPKNPNSPTHLNGALLNVIVNDPNKVVESIDKKIGELRYDIQACSVKIKSSEDEIKRLSHMRMFFLESDTKEQA
jgi:hypothetical protein